MTCPVCAGKGLVRLNWADAAEEYAVCLCDVGQALRSTQNYQAIVVPLWQVWAAREHVDPSRIVMLEDVLTVEELAERGFRVAPDADTREAALLAAGRSKRPKL